MRVSARFVSFFHLPIRLIQTTTGAIFTVSITFMPFYVVCSDISRWRSISNDQWFMVVVFENSDSVTRMYVYLSYCYSIEHTTKSLPSVRLPVCTSPTVAVLTQF